MAACPKCEQDMPYKPGMTLSGKMACPHCNTPLVIKLENKRVKTYLVLLVLLETFIAAIAMVMITALRYPFPTMLLYIAIFSLSEAVIFVILAAYIIKRWGSYYVKD
jgi:uncharacterized membrane protein